MLGDVLCATNQRRWWSEPEVEDDDDGDVVGRPRMHGSSGMMKMMRRSRWTRRLVEGRAVSAVAVSGGDELARLRERAREARQGERGAVEGVQGAAWRCPGRRGSGGNQEVARRVASARRARALAYWREEGDREALVGWAVQLGHQVGCNR